MTTRRSVRCPRDVCPATTESQQQTNESRDVNKTMSVLELFGIAKNLSPNVHTKITRALPPRAGAARLPQAPPKCGCGMQHQQSRVGGVRALFAAPRTSKGTLHHRRRLVLRSRPPHHAYPRSRTPLLNSPVDAHCGAVKRGTRLLHLLPVCRPCSTLRLLPTRTTRCGAPALCACIAWFSFFDLLPKKLKTRIAPALTLPYLTLPAPLSTSGARKGRPALSPSAPPPPRRSRPGRTAPPC